MSIKNVDLSNNTNKITGNIEENLNNNNILTTNNSKVSNEQEFKIVKNYKILQKTQNLMVINLPPNKNGKLVQSDVDNLMKVSKTLGINRCKV